jgi:hypothetical protein
MMRGPRVVVEPSIWRCQPLRRSWSPQAPSCRQASYYSRVKNHLTQPDPTLSRTRIYPEGIRIHRIGPRRLGCPTGHVGCWPTSWEAATARSRGCGPSTTATPGRPRPSGSPATRSWRPESRRGRVVPGAVGAHDRAGCGREVADPDAGAHTAFPPHPGRCPPAASARSSDSPRRLKALPMTDWTGERPACPHLRKLRQ